MPLTIRAIGIKVGVDENQNVSPLVGPDAQSATQDAAQARLNAQNAMDVDQISVASQSNAPPVKLIVIDGIVMGPAHCAFENCKESLARLKGAVFCAYHERQCDNLCRMHNCNNQKLESTHTCAQHQNQWVRHINKYGRQSLLGIRQLIRCTEEESLDWLPPINRQVQQHDAEPTTSNQRDNYFTAPHFYCVETICAPCGTVIAWTLFDKAESPTNILTWLDEVYPTPELRPDFICIDKACMILRTAISNRSWRRWKLTSRFIVDSYHHRTTDYLCRKWCNPAPINGSSPNLVTVDYDKNGRPHYKCAFNTQACEQLNAWIGGFQSILNHMTIDNFNWYLHSPLKELYKHK